MSKDDGNKDVPTWTGQVCDLQDFRTQCVWFRLATPADKRDTCGPKVIRKLRLSPKAWALVHAIDSKLACTDSEDGSSGLLYIVDFLARSSGQKEIQEVGDLCSALFTDVSRLPDEVRGWFLLEKANLTSTERSNVRASTGGSLAYARVEKALLDMYPEKGSSGA